MGVLECGSIVTVVDGSIEHKSGPTVRAVKLLNNLSQMDGRTRSVRAVTEFTNQIQCDLVNDLSEAQKCLVRRAAVLNAALTDCDTAWARTGELDLSTYCTAVNSLRRLVVTLGVSRVQRPAGVVELMEHD